MSHLVMAASEDTFRRLFAALRDGAASSTDGREDAGPFSVEWDVGYRLEGGRVDLQSDGTVRLNELDVVYDPLSVAFGLDIPRVCVGGQCILPNPFGGCAVRLPQICVFEADPDIRIPIDLSGLIVSEISGGFRLDTRRFRDPARPAGMSDHDAQDAGLADMWQIMLVVDWLDIDVIDISDTVGNILDAAIEAAVNGLLGGLPGWVRDLVLLILGSVVDLVRRILDIGDDIDEWLSNLLGTSIGLFDTVIEFVTNYFADRNPLFEFETPYPMLPAQGNLIPVKVPIADVSINVTDREMVVSAEVGA